MAKFTGTDIKLYIPTQDVDNDTSTTVWEPAALATESSLNVNVAGIDVTNKDSSGWAEELNGTRDWEVTFSGIADNALELSAGFPNVRSFFTYVNSRSKIKIAWGQDGYHWYGDAHIRNFSMSAGVEDKVTTSLTLKGTSTLSMTWDGTGPTDIDSSATYPNA